MSVPWPSLVVEAVAVLTFFACFVEAWNRWSLGPLLAGTLFGLLCELFFVFGFEGYEYGKFLLAVPVNATETVPVWVALGWGSIVWVSMQAGSRSGLPWWAAGVHDSILALSLDLALDPLAEALGWWNWKREGQYFGIPCDNFIGWMLIVGSLSAFTRLGWEKLSGWRGAVPFAAIAPAILVIVAGQYGLPYLYEVLGEPVTFLLFLAVAAGLVSGTSRETKPVVPGERPWYIFGVPSIFGILFVSLGIMTMQPGGLLVAMGLGFLTSLLLFGWRTR